MKKSSKLVKITTFQKRIYDLKFQIPTAWGFEKNFVHLEIYFSFQIRVVLKVIMNFAAQGNLSVIEPQPFFLIRRFPLNPELAEIIGYSFTHTSIAAS